jgi:hypothetical protein
MVRRLAEHTYEASYVTVSCIIANERRATGRNFPSIPDNFLINLTFTLPTLTDQSMVTGYATVS